MDPGFKGKVRGSLTMTTPSGESTEVDEAFQGKCEKTQYAIPGLWEP